MRWSAIAALGLAMGCGSTQQAPGDGGHGDGAGAPDVMLVGVDTDGDGLCDATEARLRTDPRNADTDGDGLLDSFEVAIGSNPLSLLDPPPNVKIALAEQPEALATAEQSFEYQGLNGEVLGADIVDRDRGIDGLYASDLGLSVLATHADPAAFVRGIMGARFLGVLGLVRLNWEITAGHAPVTAQAPLRCRRAYEFLFAVKREGDALVYVQSMILDVAPRPGAGDAGAGVDAGGPGWARVSPDGLCLPMGPCQ